MELDKLSRDAVNVTEIPSSSNSQHDSTYPTLPPRPASTWPQEPVPLIPDKKSSMWAAVYDGVLLTLPLLLIAKIGLVIAAWHLDRAHRGADIDLVSVFTTFLIELNGQLVTAFTIVFVTIVSTLVRRYALWKAQRGAYVSELEQLQGSISLPSTLKLIWSLRAFTTTSIALVGVWSFYYLGSQASKREFVKVSSGSFHKLEGYTPGLKYPSGFYPIPQSDYAYSTSFDVNGVNEALIAADTYAVAPFQNGPQGKPGMDMNGSPLIPNLKSIMEFGWTEDSRVVGAETQRHGWVDVSKQSRTKASDFYTSLVGKSIYFVLSNDQYGVTAVQAGGIVGDYDYKTHYLEVGCGYPTILPYHAFINGTQTNQSISFNATQIRPDSPRDTNGHPLREFDLWTRWIPDNDNGVTGYGSSRQTCNIAYVNVEVKVHCQDSGCFPQKMRYINGTTRENALSYQTPFDNDEFAANFFSNLLLSHGTQTNVSKPFLTAAGNDLAMGLQGTLGSGYNYDFFLNLHSNGQAINNSLTKYFNTYYMISQDALELSYTNDNPYMTDIDVHGAFFDPNYAIFWEWIAMDAISCIILLAASIAALWLRTQTLAPDIFGYVSSLTRDNPHLELPPNGTTLSGIQRARMLKTVKVKIGDVSSPDEPTGRVGLAQVTAASDIEPLKRTTNYV